MGGVLAAVLLVCWAPSASGANATTFSGQAVVLKGKVAGIQLPCVAGPSGCSGVVDTGPVAPEGGALSSTLLCYPDGPSCFVGLPDLTGGAARAEVLHAATVAHGSKSRSEAEVASLSVSAAGHTIGVDLLLARAEASCNDGNASVSASSEIAELVIDGQTIAVTGQAGQTVNLPGGGFVVINQQIATVNEDSGDVTVNALHIVVPGPIPGTDTDLIVAQAHADILCARPAPPPKCDSAKDFVTGGGWIRTQSGSRANWAAAGGVKNGGYWGHLSYIDHGAGMKVKGTCVTAYSGSGVARHIEGTAEVNGLGGYTYSLDVADNGEPGRDDTFSITVTGSSPYAAANTLSGGNVQLHTPCQ
jgi:hypothetical protein